MKRLGFLSLLIAVSAIAARRPCRYRQRGYCKGEFAVALRYLDTSTPSPGVVDPCTAFSSELVAPDVCHNWNTGTEVSSTGMALAAVGSPTSQTMPWCGNGLSCGSVSRQVLSTANYYATASTSAPTGDFSICWRGIIDAPLANATLASGPGWSLVVTSAGVATFTSGGSSVSSAAGAVVGGADQQVCGTRSGTLGTVAVGSAVTSGTVAAPVGSGTVTVGQANNLRVRFALLTGKALSSTTIANIHNATAPTPQGTRGEQLTFARNSLASCTAPDGSITWLQPGRPCVSGGLRVRPATTTATILQEQIDQTGTGKWLLVNVSAPTANTTTAPDGSTTADTVTSTVAGGYVYQTVTSTGGAATMSAYAKAPSGSPTVAVEVYDATSSTSLKLTSCTATTSWPTRPDLRCIASVASTTSGHSIQFRFYPAGTAAAGSVYAWGLQGEWSAVASDPCRAETTAATCAAETASVPMPASASATVGCAKACIAPMWSGAEPYGVGHFYVVANGTTARLIQTPAASQAATITDGTNFANQNTTFTTGTKRCYLSKWDGTGASITDLSSGLTTSNASIRLSGFGSTLAIGHNGGGASIAAATISDIQLGASAGACQ